MPRLTPGFEPWRPLFVAKLPELEELLRADLGPIRARTIAAISASLRAMGLVFMLDPRLLATDRKSVV